MNSSDAMVPAPIEPSDRLDHPTSAEDHSGARGDDHLVELWLKTKRSPHTRRAYAADVQSLLNSLKAHGKTLRYATLADIQAWVDELVGAATSRARRIAAIKSLLGFGFKTGYLRFNVGQVLEAPRTPNTLAERILTEEEVHRMLMVAKGRDEVLLRFLYVSGARISEACALRWEHIHPQENGEAVVTLHGKNGKTRHVLVSEGVASVLGEFRDERVSLDALVFASRTGRPLDSSNVVKMVRRIARRASINRAVSPHWFRHAHASHALDRGAPVHLVQSTLGHASVATTGRYLHARPEDGSGRYLSV